MNNNKDVYSVSHNSILTIAEIKDKLNTLVSVIDKDFPHISRNILKKWGKISFYTYMQTLFVSDRDEIRQGFPLDVLSELQLVFDAHTETFPDIYKAYQSTANFKYI